MEARENFATDAKKITMNITLVRITMRPNVSPALGILPQRAK
jgi:hypothetical protein